MDSLITQRHRMTPKTKSYRWACVIVFSSHRLIPHMLETPCCRSSSFKCMGGETRVLTSKQWVPNSLQPVGVFVHEKKSEWEMRQVVQHITCIVILTQISHLPHTCAYTFSILTHTNTHECSLIQPLWQGVSLLLHYRGCSGELKSNLILQYMH